MKAIFDVIRKKCPAGLWSLGVKLAREGSVVFDARSEAQIDARVRVPLKPVPPSVTLYPPDREWTCDCGGRSDPCEHVAAVVIAAQQAADEPQASVETSASTSTSTSTDSGPSTSPSPIRSASTPAKATRSHVGYRLIRKEQSLYLHRSIVDDVGGETPLAVGLASAIARGVAATLLAEHDDLLLDRLLQGNPRAFLPVARLPEVFGLLAGARDVKLDGAPVRVSGAPIAPRAVVLDRGRRSCCASSAIDA